MAKKMFKTPSRTVTDPGANGPIAKTVERILSGDVVPGAQRRPLPPGDYTGVPTLTEAMTQSRRAKEAFERLPSGIRDQFANDPLKLNDFMLSSDPADLERSYQLGLRVRPKPTPAPAPAPAPVEGGGSTE